VCLFEGHRHLNPSVEFENPEAGGRRLRALVESKGLEIADVFVVAATDRETLAPNNPSVLDRRNSRDVFSRALDYVAAAGARHLTQLPGVMFPELGADRSFEEARIELAWRAERAATSGITFAVEPHAGSIVETPDAALRLIKAAGKLTYTLDYSHFTKAGFADSEIDPLLGFASHFHIRGAREGRLQCSFVSNRTDYAAVLQKLSACGYSGCHAIEYVWIEWEHCNECDIVSETVLLRDYLRSLPLFSPRAREDNAS
jgi:sugar phosphate isomerase/epimerase